MIFAETKIKGAYVIEPERLSDERGFFARTWCQEEFQNHGLNTNIVQCNISYNEKRGTLRGMHYQAAPWGEAKLVRCTAGAVFDVIIDLRPNSTTYREWTSVEMTAENRKMLYVPEGCAHGFLTLQDETELFYQMSERYSAVHARGVRWDDPAFGIRWPAEVAAIADKDRLFADFRP